jgi:hypothetical protein
MPYIMYEKNEAGENVVTYVTYETNLPQELLERCTYIEEFTLPEAQFMKEAVCLYDEENNKIYYKYVDRPPTRDEQMELLKQENEELKARIELMQQALDDLLLGGM